MKRTLLCTILLVFAAAGVNAADAAALFRELPTPLFKDIDRAAAMAGNAASADVLKLKLPDNFSGEFRVISETAKETVIGLSVYSCDESQFEVWSKRGGVWKDVSKSAGPKLGKSDVTAMLAVSPVTVEKLGTNVSVSYFFSFAEANGLKLFVRRQSTCEIAGAAREYRFDGRRYNINK